MSIYRALQTEQPVVSYGILHQAVKSITPKEYQQTLIELMEGVLEESAKAATQWSDYKNELRLRTVQTLRGTLSQFLSTPLQSDFNEIQKILGDQMAQVIQGIDSVPSLGARQVYVGKALLPAVSSPALKKMIFAGKSLMKDLGFKLSKERSDLFEMRLSVDGGANLDVLEHIIRDRMGIYASAHGQHIKQFAVMSTTVHNQFFAAGEHAAKARFEAAIHFPKPLVEYIPFRETLRDLGTNAFQSLKPVRVTLWQRKLGLGAGPEFTLRLAYDEPSQLKNFLELLSDQPKKSLIRQSVLEEGSLILYELQHSGSK